MALEIVIDKTKEMQWVFKGFNDKVARIAGMTQCLPLRVPYGWTVWCDACLRRKFELYNISLRASYEEIKFKWDLVKQFIYSKTEGNTNLGKAYQDLSQNLRKLTNLG